MTTRNKKIVEALSREMDGCRIVSLKEVVQGLGIQRLTTREILPIVESLKHHRPDYRPIRFVGNMNDNISLWESLHFVENGTEFETEEEWLQRQHTSQID